MKIILCALALSSFANAKNISCAVHLKHTFAPIENREVQLQDHLFESRARIDQNQSYAVDIYGSAGQLAGIRITDKEKNISFVSNGNHLQIQDSNGREIVYVHCLTLN